MGDAMKKILMTLAYDGTEYCGWQKQKSPEVPTVQASVERALKELFRTEIECTGASRTDRGVHALGQRITFEAETTIPVDKIPLALNPYLPRDIVVQKAEEVSEKFHVRFDVTDKTYEYTFYVGQVPNPLLRRTAEFERSLLDVKKMNQGAAFFVGEHDFQAFCAAGNSTVSTVRRIFFAEVIQQQEKVIFRVNGSGFLYNMVRIMAGTLLDVGKGRIRPERIPEIIESKNRSYAGKTVGPQGLCLIEIHYPQS
ncbi:MAG: tRNA pseudouridine(38-40) synthase TruA [Clostridiales bacterium]|nr:tRNA pseudouridine(38-40) synthase TruA [Clostridiales bacterium]